MSGIFGRGGGLGALGATGGDGSNVLPVVAKCPAGQAWMPAKFFPDGSTEGGYCKIIPKNPGCPAGQEWYAPGGGVPNTCKPVCISPMQRNSSGDCVQIKEDKGLPVMPSGCLIPLGYGNCATSKTLLIVGGAVAVLVAAIVGIRKVVRKR